jgi:hypothetical protein
MGWQLQLYDNFAGAVPASIARAELEADEPGALSSLVPDDSSEDGQDVHNGASEETNIQVDTQPESQVFESRRPRLPSSAETKTIPVPMPVSGDMPVLLPPPPLLPPLPASPASHSLTPPEQANATSASPAGPTPPLSQPKLNAAPPPVEVDIAFSAQSPFAKAHESAPAAASPLPRLTQMQGCDLAWLCNAT